MKRDKQWHGLVVFQLLVLVVVFQFGNGCGGNGELPRYKRPGEPVEQRVNDLLRRMSLEEKIEQLSGTGFETKENIRLGIPGLRMSDGPVGVRYGKATAFPAAVGLAATWNKGLVKRVGAAIGMEMRARGRNVLLGPCVNIHRHPLGGRNFESYGEDPFLASQMAIAFIKGIQGKHIIASVKHFACNNQEWDRMKLDVHVDERALREIYLPAFEAAVKEAGVWSVMASYNQIEGEYCCENGWLLTDILKREWGFQGFVVSDWEATHSTVPAALAGLDLEMPYGRFFGSSLLESVKAGKIKLEVIDDKVRRLLRVRFKAGFFDRPPGSEITGTSGGSDENKHVALALESAIESMVLLKNEREVLPIDRNGVRTIAVIGPNGGVSRTGGGGSSRVTPYHTVSPLEGLKKKLGKEVRILYTPAVAAKGDLLPILPGDVLGGWQGEYFDNPLLEGDPVVTQVDGCIDFNWGYDGLVIFEKRPGLHNNFSVRWQGEIIAPVTGVYRFEVLHNNAFRLFIDGQLVLGNMRKMRVVFKSVERTLTRGQRYRVRLEYSCKSTLPVIKLGWQCPGYDPIGVAVDMAKKADVVVVCAGLNEYLEGEGLDRRWLELPNQDILIEAVATVNPHTIVVLNTGGPVLMKPWFSKVPVIIQAWYPGQEGGNALVAILLGDANPSAKLPVSFIASEEQCPAFKGYKEKTGLADYKEGIFVGYRYLEQYKMTPLFAFGHGLSYTTFEYSGLEVTPIGNGAFQVAIAIRNTGSYAGAEVVQVYVKDIQSSLPRPEKELKGFDKVYLEPGQSQRVTVLLREEAFAFFHPGEGGWKSEPGEFEILVGSSSRDIRLIKRINK